MEFLSTARTDKDIKLMVEKLPNGIDHTYQTLLCDTAARFPERVAEMRILFYCLVGAASPLTAAQLSEIIAMQPGKRHLDFDTVATDPYDTLDLIASFVIIDREGKTDGLVRLAHYSLEEYFCSQSIRNSAASFFYVDAHEADAWLASICLQYLTFEVFNEPLYEDLDQDVLEGYTFREYASLNWFRHVNAAEDDPRLQNLCSQYLEHFLDADEGPPCYKRWQEMITMIDPNGPLVPYSPICFCIWAGMNAIALRLIAHLSSVDHHFENGHTCLTVAAKYNNLPMIQELLRLGANIDMPTKEPDYLRALTPLHFAAEWDAQQAFDFLLDNGADPHIPSSSGATPFYRACRGGDLRIVRRLKDCGCNINALTRDGWTPLIETVENGHEDVVELLLEWGADLFAVTDEGWTALSFSEYLDKTAISNRLRRAGAMPRVEEAGILQTKGQDED